jgi:hypothetical protein
MLPLPKTGETPRRRSKELGLDGPGAAGPFFKKNAGEAAGPEGASQLEKGDQPQ